MSTSQGRRNLQLDRLLQIKITLEMQKGLRAKAKAQGVTVSDMIRDLVDDELLTDDTKEHERREHLAADIKNLCESANRDSSLFTSLRAALKQTNGAA